jgi:murein DD-endopeptidase MepM/ murein hydrolase activator NlpD
MTTLPPLSEREGLRVPYIYGEEDDFIVNDVALRIPPSQISIKKQSFNKEYSTLRTRVSRKVKSGHSMARIAVSIVFQGEDDINNKLRQMVAGLVSTPFCVVYNKHIEESLRTVEQSGKSKYKEFQPVVLAWTSMTFSTMGSQDMPDCIQANLDFLWFNYLPYTPIWAYKTGEMYDKYGPIWDSVLWPMFYAPHLFKTRPIKWPHTGTDSMEGKVDLLYREFMSVPKGDSKSSAAIGELLDIIKNRPKKFFENWVHLQNNHATINESDDLDLTAKRLVQKGAITRESALGRMAQNSERGLSTAGGDVIYPLLRRLTRQAGENPSNLVQAAKNKGNQAAINDAIAMVKQRTSTLQKLETEGVLANSEEVVGNWDEVLDVNIDLKAKDNEGKRKGSATVGGMKLLTRQKKYCIHPIAETGPIIEQVTIAFRNTLSVIPMVGYRYPTIQHMGSIDANVSIVINGLNSQIRRLHGVYDMVETMNLRFKQVPRGLQTVFVENDFLKLFGVSEFIMSELTSDTIPSQPNRSQAVLTLSQAGVDSKTTMGSDKLKQEFVQTSKSIRSLIWSILKKDLRVNKSAGKINFQAKKVMDNSKLESAISPSKRGELYYYLLNKAAAIYNKFLKEVDKAIFGSGEYRDRQQTYGEIMNLSANVVGIGFLPNIDQVQKFVSKRQQKLGQKTDIKSGQGYAKTTSTIQKDRTSSAWRRQQLSADKSDKEAGRFNTNANTLLARKKQLRMDAGIFRYEKGMRELFDEIKRKYLGLPIFKQVAEEVEKLGLGKGSLAYPDFAESLQSISSVFSGESETPLEDLAAFEPDCYMWYPLFSDTKSLVDPSMLAAAKHLSITAAETGMGNTNDFFQGTYKRLLKDSGWDVPFKALEEETQHNPDGGVAVFYSNIKYPSSANRKNNEKISKSVKVDGVAKIPSSWYNTTAGRTPPINALVDLEHGTDVKNHLWGGVKAGGTSSGSADRQTPDEPSDWGDDETASGRNSSELKLDWPVRAGGLTKAHPPGYKFGVSRGSRPHKGVDLGGPATGGALGEPVFAAAKGRILAIQHNPSRGGLMLFIRHEGGWQTGYMHLKLNSIPARYKKVGTPVEKGAQIGRVGKTGIKRSPAHLHFAVIDKKKVRHDPMKFLPPYPAAQTRKARRRNVARNNPAAGSAADLRNRAIARKETGRDVTSTLASPLGQAIREFERDLNRGQAQALRRAYPTFKLYFVEEEGDYEEKKRFAFDDFFSYSSVKSIRVVRSRKIAADLCVLELVNLSGVLTNKKFRQEQGSGKEPRDKNGNVVVEGRTPGDTNTIKENPMASLLLQEGINIHLRLGYSSDPDRLDTVFNGTITAIEFSDNEDLIRVVAQSYAVELVQDQKGVTQPNTKRTGGLGGWMTWGFTNDASTSRILEEMISEPEVTHFGRWIPGTSGTANRDLLTDKWQFVANPADDNIFAPPPGTDLDNLGKGMFFKNLQYTIYRTTIWDIFKEMELRHPNFISSPVPYEAEGGNQRMTMFYGLPNQLYFAKHPKADEILKHEKLKKVQEESLQKIIDGLVTQSGLSKYAFSTSTKAMAAGVVSWLTKLGFGEGAVGQVLARTNAETVRKGVLHAALTHSEAGKQIKQITDTFWREVRLGVSKESGSIKPFRSYHLVTSRSHIVANNIRADSRDVANTIVIKYPKNIVRSGAYDFDEVDPTEADFDSGEYIVKQDAAIPNEDMRTQVGQFLNVTHNDVAKRYGLGLLQRNLKEIYKGELVVLGNPKMKPYDVCTCAGTKILMANGGYKNVEDMQVGDKVYSHTGKQQRVDQLFKRKSHQPILKVKCNADPEEIFITTNHPVLSVLRNDIYKDGKMWKKQDNFIPQWRPIGELTKRDYLAQPRIRSKKSMPVPLARLLGYYLAEGNIIWEWRKTFNRGRRYNKKQNPLAIKCCRVPVAIQWSFNSETEMFMVDEINQLLGQLGYKKTARHHLAKGKKGLSIIFHDRELTNQFIQLAGYSDKDGLKKDNKWMRQYYDDHTTRHILAAYFEGDGCYSKGIKISAGTTSYNLGRNLRQMLINIGVPVGSAISKGKSFGKNCKAYYNVVPTTSTHEFSGYFQPKSRFTGINYITPSQYAGSTTTIVDDLFVYLPISKIGLAPEQNQLVYNIGVSNDNSYIAQNKTVHNCYVFDEYTDMVGPVEIEQVTHFFSQETGFITEIIPDMLCAVGEWSLLSSCEALGVVMEGIMRKMYSQRPSSDHAFSPWAFMIGSGIGMIGGFMANKIINYTQLGNPVVMSPLALHGRPFTGGVPTRRMKHSLWTSFFGNYSASADEGYDEWKESIYDKFTHWAKKNTGMYSTGNFSLSGGRTRDR